MCGFLFSVATEGWSEAEHSALQQAASRLATRGNTSSGEYTCPHLQAFHYRLAFRDLKDGAQPMLDSTQNHVLTFNGELYDFRRFRARLDYEFTTDSDTEVILATIATGQLPLIEEFDGEFAFAAWSKPQKKLFAARDPFGVKPLYVGIPAPLGFETDQFRKFQQRYELNLPAGQIHIASEIKGLPIAPKWDTKGVMRQFCSLYEEIATPFRNVIQIPPGGLLELEMRENGTWKGSLLRLTSHRRQALPPNEISFSDTQSELRRLVAKEVENRLDADVELGTYLSGGIDSRIITHNMIQAGYKPKSFTVGFEDAGYDEVDEVRKFIRTYDEIDPYLLKTTNSALDYSYRHAIYASEIIQPYTNGAAKWWLSRLAMRHVRGVLTGDGADEIFCGYPSYKYVHWWQYARRSPSSRRNEAYRLWMGIGDQDPWEAGVSSNVDGSDLARSESIWGWAHPLFWQVESLAEIMLGPENGEAWIVDQSEDIISYISPDQSPMSNWQNYFLRTHFPTHVLNWVGDRMEMANTLEGRPPFLSKSIWDLVSTTPDHYLVRGFLDKALLRAAFEPEIGELAKTPKKQFNAPFLFNEELGKEYLDRDRIDAAGVIPWDSIERAKDILRLEKSAMRRSYANIFLQNTVVFHLLDDFLVQGNSPERDLDYEEKFLDENTENIK